MLKEIYYYGEIWMPENENEKFFCKLDFSTKEVILETNLSSNLPEFKKELFYGCFNGLGYLTFINNIVVQSVSGMIEFRKYCPKYVFISSNHLIIPFDLIVTSFRVENNVLNEWIRTFHDFDFENFKVEKIEGFSRKIIINEELEIDINKSSSVSSNIHSLNLKNFGYINFESKKRLNLLESIEIYNNFQKFLFFYFGQIIPFDDFKIQCQSCGKWFSMFCSDLVSNKKISSLISLNYQDLNEDLDLLLKNWFTNEDLKFCTDIIIENLLSEKVSYSRRFTNSISAFEAFNKRFGIKHHKPTLERWLNDNKNVFIEIMNIECEIFEEFCKKIIRTRDFFVHANKKQTDCFDSFELLYVSLLIDFVVAIGVSKNIHMSENNINKILYQAKSVYIDMQRTNKILRSNIFLKDISKTVNQ
jgi:hypothetical protein